MDNKLDLVRWGKFIVASNQDEMARLHEIFEQGIKNGIDIKLMPRSEALKKEPLMKGYGDAVIYSPNTSVGNPVKVIQWISYELQEKYGNYCTQFYNQNGLIFEGIKQGDKTSVTTNDSRFETKYLINCAGQQSLSIAQQFAFGPKYIAIPVKGNYLISNRVMNEIKTLVYPVPMKNTYFLGVHSTLTPEGKVKIGPSATPAFSAENYHGLRNILPFDAMSILSVYFRMMFSKQIKLIKSLATQELPKLSKTKMIESCRKIHDVDPNAFTMWYPPGIRAQLVERNSLKFVEDFKLEYDGYSMHVLNTISPGWTWASPFSDHIIDEISTVFKLK